MLASIVAHGLASNGHFNTFLTRGLYDPRMLVNVIYPFLGDFADASVDKFIEYVSYISEINQLDYQKTYETIMSDNLSGALMNDNVELFAHIILTKHTNFQYVVQFHLPYKRKCFEWCFKNFKWGAGHLKSELIRSDHAIDYAYLLNENQIRDLLFRKPEFMIHFSNLTPNTLEFIIQNNLHILYDEKICTFYKNICEAHNKSKDPFIDKVITYTELLNVELFKLEENILSNFNFDSLDRNNKRQELEQALKTCELRIINRREHLRVAIRSEFKQHTYSINDLPSYHNDRLLHYAFKPNTATEHQIIHETLCLLNYGIYVCWLHKRYDIIYNLYYKINLSLQTVRLPPLNEAQFKLALPPMQSNDAKYHIYAMCFINNRVDLVKSIVPLEKIDYHQLLNKIAQLDEEHFYDIGKQTIMSDETKFIIKSFLQPSKVRTFGDDCNTTFLIRASILEDEKPDKILADIQIRLLELGAFNILDRFTVLADDLWIRAVNSLNYYALKYLLNRGFKPIGNENITGGQCYDLICQYA